MAENTRIPTAEVTGVHGLMPSAGTKINQYEIIRELGAGGMGTVYLARDITLDREVAIKLHRAGTGSERLHRDAMAMAKVASRCDSASLAARGTMAVASAAAFAGAGLVPVSSSWRMTPSA